MSKQTKPPGGFTCATCVYFSKTEFNNKEVKDIKECRRKAPDNTPDKWPYTKEDRWCGEYEPREGA